MPKLLSRSKHEEFKSNSALQIKDQKERRAKSEEKWSIAKFGSCEHYSFMLPVPAVTHFCCFVTVFGFFPILTLVIALVSVFLVISLALSRI